MNHPENVPNYPAEVIATVAEAKRMLARANALLEAAAKSPSLSCAPTQLADYDWTEAQGARLFDLVDSLEKGIDEETLEAFRG